MVGWVGRSASGPRHPYQTTTSTTDNDHTMRYSGILALCAAFLFQALTTLAQSAPGTPQLQPNATCPYPTSDIIVQCLAQVEQDEAQRPGGPCNDGDWPCICNKQQGLIACWAPCYDAQPLDQINYNNENCNGQHGVTNAAASGGNGAQYSGSPLTTSAELTGSIGSTPASTAASTTPSSTEAPTSTTNSASSIPSPTTTAPSGSSNGADMGHAPALAFGAVAVMAAALLF